MNNHWLEIIYLIGSVTFVGGLKLLGNPETARRGNIFAGIGMIIAIAGTLILNENKVAPFVYALIFTAIGIGSVKLAATKTTNANTKARITPESGDLAPT